MKKAAKSDVPSNGPNIVEGYGRRRYKQEFIRFLTYSLALHDERTGSSPFFPVKTDEP